METFVSLVSLKNNRRATFLYSMSDKTSAIVIIIKVDKITMAKKNDGQGQSDKGTKGQKNDDEIEKFNLREFKCFIRERQ